MKIESKCWIFEGVAHIDLQVPRRHLNLLEDEEAVMREVMSNIAILQRLSLREVLKDRITKTLHEYGKIDASYDSAEDIAEQIVLDLAGAGVNLERLEEPKEEGGEEV